MKTLLKVLSVNDTNTYWQHLFSILTVFKLFTTPCRFLTTLKNKGFQNTVGKGENAGNHHFLLVPPCLLPHPKEEIVILAMFNLSSANAFNLVTSKILFFGKELTF